MKNCRMHSSSLLAFLLLLTGARLAQSVPCTQEHLVKCASALHLHLEVGYASKKEDLDLICPEMNSGLRCIDEYTRRCMAPQQRSHFNKLYAGSSMVIQDICQEGPYQAEFLRHVKCMTEAKQDYEECAKDYQQKIQELSNLMNNDTSDVDEEIHVRKLCCSFQEYLSCAHSIVQDTCGEETAQFTKGFLDRISSSLIQVHCEKYPPGAQICEQDISGVQLTSSSMSLVLLLGSLTTLLRWT